MRPAGWHTKAHADSVFVMTLTVRRGLKALNLKTRRTIQLHSKQKIKNGWGKVNMKYGKYDFKVKDGVTKASSILYHALQTEKNDIKRFN